MIKPGSVLTLDIETTGLDPYRDKILMVGLWDGTAYACCRDPNEFYSALTHYPGWPILGHNITFDIKFLLVKGWLDKMPEQLHDTQLMAHVIKDKVPKSFLERYEEERKLRNKSLRKGFSHRPARSLSLKVLAPWFLKVPWFWENPESHDDEDYNKKDCVYTRKLFDLFWPKLEESGLEFYQNKMLPWSKMLLEMSLKGIELNFWAMDTVHAEHSRLVIELENKLDETWADAHKTYYGMQYGALQTKYQEMAAQALTKAKDPLKTSNRYQSLLLAAAEKLPRKINYQSPDQMKWLLKDYLQLDITKVDEVEDDEDPESTGKAVLNRLASQGRDDVKTFIELRKSSKILTGFLPTYKELQVDGVLHPTFNITGTRTGRTSSSNPNLQQVPPKLYSLFKPRHGYKFIQYDLSGIEAALIALYSNDRTLYDILASGTSIHDYNASLLFDLGCPLADVKEKYPRERQTAKNLGFATFYGAGANRIKTVFGAGGFTIDDREAKSKLAILKDGYPSVFKFHKEITGIFEAGQIVENLVGRPISIADKSECYMKGFNTLIQSGASDLNLHACHRATKQWHTELPPGEAYPLLVIHDCIIAEAVAHRAEGCAAYLRIAMTDYNLTCDHGRIKLQVEGGVSERWEK
jgi:DNA polymerase I-like protein with 3'-5' exonuclease and polymerase domains